jgi:hypothetical protein
MFGFIASSLVVAPVIVDCVALDTKRLAGELEWKARDVFLAQNPTCVEALLPEVCCRCKRLILLHLMVWALAATVTSSRSTRAGFLFQQMKIVNDHIKKAPYDTSGDQSKDSPLSNGLTENISQRRPMQPMIRRQFSPLCGCSDRTALLVVAALFYVVGESEC